MALCIKLLKKLVICEAGILIKFLFFGENWFFVGEDLFYLFN